jgi:hypothetical protein
MAEVIPAYFQFSFVVDTGGYSAVVVSYDVKITCPIELACQIRRELCSG